MKLLEGVNKMPSDSVVQLLIAIATSGLFGAIINGIINRKKLGADATKIITDAAASVVTTTEKSLSDIRLREDQWETKERKWYQVLRRHEEWDRKAYWALKTQAPHVKIEEPTPLYPDEGGMN